MKKIGKLFIYLALTTVILFSSSAYANTKWEIYSNSQKFTQPEKTLTLQEKFAILEPYSNALITMFGEIAIRYNTETPFEELVKNMTKKAFDAMLEMDKHGQAFVPEEYLDFMKRRTGIYVGIGIHIEQPERWVLREKTETPLTEVNKQTKEESAEKILKILMTDPDGKIMTDITKEIPTGSNLLIEKKCPQNTDNLLTFKYEYTRGSLRITKTITGAGAEKNGLKDGDIILEAQGKKTKNLTISENIKNIKGPKGTKVNFLIKRGDEQFSAQIERMDVDLNEATTEVKFFGENNRIGYIKLMEFNENVSDIFKKELKNIGNKNIDKLIIDLRNNPGGSLFAVLEMLDYLMPRGAILICVKNQEEIQETHKSRKDPLFNGNIIVLTNEMSASASEIMSGVLQRNDHKTAGKKTFGKGSIQTIIGVPDNDAIKAIKLTIQEYQVYDPKINDYIKIDGVGIKPNIECDPNLPIEKILELPEVKEYFKIK